MFSFRVQIVDSGRLPIFLCLVALVITFVTTVSAVAVLVHVALVTGVVLKGKYELALVGAFIPTISVIGAWRLARPQPLWARRRYHGRKMERAVRRAAKHDARWGPYTGWLTDFVAGAPVQPATDPGPSVRP